jgi:Lecithin retinol acyltransferase
MFVQQQQRVPTLAPATFTPCAGDWVKVFLPRLGIWHEGIVVDVARFYGGQFQATITHSMKGKGVIQSSWLHFSENQPVHHHRRATSHQHVQEILQRAYSSLNAPYFLLTQNCQHFASFAFTGKAESPAVRVAGGAGLVAVLLALFG